MNSEMVMTHAKQGLQMKYLGCHNMFTKTKEKNLLLIHYTARVWCLQIIKLYLHFYFTTPLSANWGYRKQSSKLASCLNHMVLCFRCMKMFEHSCVRCHRCKTWYYAHKHTTLLNPNHGVVLCVLF